MFELETESFISFDFHFLVDVSDDFDHFKSVDKWRFQRDFLVCHANNSFVSADSNEKCFVLEKLWKLPKAFWVFHIFVRFESSKDYGWRICDNQENRQDLRWFPVSFCSCWKFASINNPKVDDRNVAAKQQRNRLRRFLDAPDVKLNLLHHFDVHPRLLQFDINHFGSSLREILETHILEKKVHRKQRKIVDRGENLFAFNSSKVRNSQKYLIKLSIKWIKLDLCADSNRVGEIKLSFSNFSSCFRWAASHFVCSIK